MLTEACTRWHPPCCGKLISCISCCAGRQGPYLGDILAIKKFTRTPGVLWVAQGPALLAIAPCKWSWYKPVSHCLQQHVTSVLSAGRLVTLSLAPSHSCCRAPKRAVLLGVAPSGQALACCLSRRLAQPAHQHPVRKRLLACLERCVALSSNGPVLSLCWTGHEDSVKEITRRQGFSALRSHLEICNASLAS